MRWKIWAWKTWMKMTRSDFAVVMTCWAAKTTATLQIPRIRPSIPICSLYRSQHFSD